MRNVELGVMGHIVQDPSLLTDSGLDASYFREQDLQQAFVQVYQLDQEGKKITADSLKVCGVPVTLMDKLETLRLKDDYTHLSGLLKLSRRKEQVRSMATSLMYTLEKASTEEVIIDQVSKMYEVLAPASTEGSLKSLDVVIKGVLDTLEAGNEGVIATGFTCIDDIVMPFEPGSYTLLAGRPSMGKTTLSRQMAMSISREYSVLYFSMEESSELLIRKMLCGTAGISFFRTKKEGMTAEELQAIHKAQEYYSTCKFFVDDNHKATPAYIRHRAKMIKSVHGLDVIFVDYLQLMPAKDKDTRNEVVSAQSRQMKMLARELNVSVCVLSQLSRGVEARRDKKPRLHDLRDSGSLEQDADVVLFISAGDIGNPMRDVTVAKQRNGPVGGTILDFDHNTGRFYDALEAEVGDGVQEGTKDVSSTEDTP